jgi:hypothetical protein
MIQHKIINLFPISIIQIEFDKHHEYNFSNIEKKVCKPDAWECSVNTSFPEILDNDSFISPITRDCLIIDITKCIKKVFNQLNLTSDIYIDEFWYNIYHDNQGQEIHDHLGGALTRTPFWSGIYYNKNSSPTTFIRPGKLYKMQSYSGCGESLLSSSFSERYHTEVKDGDIILFPPYLDHHVESKECHKDNMRLTFSFNVDLFKNLR